MTRYIEADNIEKDLVRYADSIDKTQTFSGVLRLIVRDTPTADVVPVKRGKWLNVERAPNNMWYCTCSVCKERQTVEVANYCPMCGATMEVEDDG